MSVMLVQYKPPPINLWSGDKSSDTVCLNWFNNVKHSVKHTPAALYIMHQRPVEGFLWKDNMS